MHEEWWGALLVAAGVLLAMWAFLRIVAALYGVSV